MWRVLLGAQSQSSVTRCGLPKSNLGQQQENILNHTVAHNQICLHATASSCVVWVPVRSSPIARMCRLLKMQALYHYINLSKITCCSLSASKEEYEDRGWIQCTTTAHDNFYKWTLIPLRSPYYYNHKISYVSYDASHLSNIYISLSETLLIKMWLLNPFIEMRKIHREHDTRQLLFWTIAHDIELNISYQQKHRLTSSFR